MSSQTIPFQTQTIAVEEPERPKIGKLPDETRLGFGNPSSFALLQRVASMYAASDFVPKRYLGHLANCCVAVNMAERMGAEVLMVMQNLYVVHGSPGWSSQFLIATFNQNGRYTSIRYEFFGEPNTDSWGCRAWCVEKSTGERLEGSDITVKLAKDNGWWVKKDKDTKENISKWPVMTQQMLMYRAAAWFIRTIAPEIAMGLRTVEEQIDMGPLMEDVIDKTAERLKEERAAAVRAAVDAAPTKLDALVNAEKAKGNGPEKAPEGTISPNPSPVQSRSTTDAAMAQAKENLRKKAEREGVKKPAEKQPDNPSYGVGSDPDPFKESGMFERAPGQEG